MGHELESFLEQPLEAIATKARVVELIDSHGLKKLDMREGGAFDDHGHDEHGQDEHHDDDHKEYGEHSEEGHDDHDGEGHEFEWAGVFKLPAGDYTWTFAKVDGDYADPMMKMVFLPTSSGGEEGIEEQEEVAERLIKYSTVVPKDQLMAGTDCGFSTFAGFGKIDENICYEKLHALVEGTKLASKII